jgi:hypothetical protein
MRAIKYKYALTLEMSVSEEDLVHEACEEAMEISKELDIRIHLTNPFTQKDCYIDTWGEETIDTLAAKLT